MKTEILTLLETDKDLSQKLAPAASIIRSGGLVVFPTETVYGLGADATSSEAAKRIFNAKGRPSDNPLIIHISDISDADKYAYTNALYYKLASAFMPGPLTVILRSKDTVPEETRGGLSTVAVRCPQNKIANTLIKLSGVPIAAPSANLSGSPSPTNADHVIDDMMGRVDMIIDGGSSDFGLESTIVKIDCADKITLLRPGKITVEDIESVVGKIEIADAVTAQLKDGEKALSPGMKYRHYAPRSEVVLLKGNIRDIIGFISKKNNLKIAVLAYYEDVTVFQKELPSSDVYSFGRREDKNEQAHTLFSILRDMDKKDYDIIYAPLPSKEGIGLALYNRMIRAAAHRIIEL